MFVTKLNTTGSALSTRRSSAARESTTASRYVDNSGNAYVLGSTSSTDFPITAGAFDTTASGALRRNTDEAEPGRLGADLLHLLR